jgi:hypothetical protein
MPKFDVDDAIAARVELLARRKPFENLTFNDAVLRLVEFVEQVRTSEGKPDALLDDLLKESMALASNRKKAPSPSASEWVASVPTLKGKKGMTNWTAVCKALRIETNGDSARRVLQKWVSENKPEWPEVPNA